MTRAVALPVAALILNSPVLPASEIAPEVRTATCEPTSWREIPAYRLRNDFIEVVVVPALGRVMHFSRPGGENWLWAGSFERRDGEWIFPHGWPNWGGDKTWLAPQSDWRALFGRSWPPDPAWGHPDEGPHVAKVLPGGGLLVSGPVSTSGLQISREYHLDGPEWKTIQKVTNVSGPRRTVAVWSVTNAPRPEATHFVPSPRSVHPEGFFLSRPEHPVDARLRDGVLTVRTTTDKIQKVGLDTPFVALAIQRGTDVFIQRAESHAGPYPHGGRGAGSSVEFFDAGTTLPDPYVEAELLGPLVMLNEGEATSFSMHWRIETLPDDSSESAANLAAIKRWLETPVPVRPIR